MAKGGRWKTGETWEKASAIVRHRPKEKRKRANRKEAVELIQRYATIQRNKRRVEMETDAACVYQALLARRGPVHAEKTFNGDRA